MKLSLLAVVAVAVLAGCDAEPERCRDTVTKVSYAEHSCPHRLHSQRVEMLPTGEGYAVVICECQPDDREEPAPEETSE